MPPPPVKRKRPFLQPTAPSGGAPGWGDFEARTVLQSAIPAGLEKRTGSGDRSPLPAAYPTSGGAT